MKQFNLKEYLENPSRKVVTRDGRNARIICTDQKGTLYKIVGLIDNGDKEAINNFTLKGESCFDLETNFDLFFAPEKYERWVNLYKENDNIYASVDTFKTKEEAEAVSCSSCIATVKVEWEE